MYIIAGNGGDGDHNIAGNQDDNIARHQDDGDHDQGQLDNNAPDRGKKHCS